MKIQSRIAWSIAFVLVVSLSAAGLASADPGRPPRGSIIIMPMADEYDPGGGSPSSMTLTGASGYCYSESRNPHSSDHVTGRINAEAYVWCSVPTFVTLHAKLYKEFAWLWWTVLDETTRSDTAAPEFPPPGVFVNRDCQGDLNYRLVTWAYPSGMNSGVTQNTQYVPCQSNP